MHSTIYSYLFNNANIKEENVIDSNAALTEVNVVYLTTNKRAKNLQKVETLCYNNKKENTKHITIIGWLVCNEWT